MRFHITVVAYIATMLCALGALFIFFKVNHVGDFGNQRWYFTLAPFYPVPPILAALALYLAHNRSRIV